MYAYTPFRRYDYEEEERLRRWQRRWRLVNGSGGAMHACTLVRRYEEEERLRRWQRR